MNVRLTVPAAFRKRMRGRLSLFATQRIRREKRPIVRGRCDRYVRTAARNPTGMTTRDEKNALVLQGGGALGSYQAGAYEALLAAGQTDRLGRRHLDRRDQWRDHLRQSAERRLEQLAKFWREISSLITRGAAQRRASWSSSCSTRPAQRSPPLAARRDFFAARAAAASRLPPRAGERSASTTRRPARDAAVARRFRSPQLRRDPLQHRLGRM